MKQLTRNFSLDEFSSHDGLPTPPELIPNLQTLAENLQILRDYLGFPIQINSGYRSPEQNKKVGGAPNSMHMQGKAADIVCQKYTPHQVYTAVLTLISQGKVWFGGVGLYDTFVHVDIRNDKVRWDLRKKA